MRFYNIEMRGKFQLKTEGGVPAFNSAYEGRLSYFNNDLYLNDSTTQRKIYHEGNSGAFALCASNNVFTCCNLFCGISTYLCNSKLGIWNCDTSSSGYNIYSIAGTCSSDLLNGIYSITYGSNKCAIIGHSVNGTSGIGVRAGASNGGTAVVACTQTSGTSLFAQTWEGKAACFHKTRAYGYAVYVEASNCTSGICVNAYTHGVRAFSCDSVALFGSSINCLGVYGCVDSGAQYAILGCADHNAQAAVYARAATTSTACGLLGVSTNRYGVYGCSVNCFAVVGNTNYCNISSKYLKHIQDVCVSECIKNKPLKVYKYYMEDANNSGFNESIGPLAEDFNDTFNLNDTSDGDGYEGLWTVDGVALGLSIENNKDIDQLKQAVVKLYECIQKLEGN